MITIGYSTRQSNPELQAYFAKSCGVKNVQVIEKVNPNGKSLTEVYNEILNESVNDIVVLCHDDIYFDTNNWGFKLLKHFEKSNFGVLGMAGTTDLSETGQWWVTNKKQNMVGIVNHEHEGKKWESKYSSNAGNSIIETVIIDGLFIALDKKRIKKTFNENFKGFHFYDLTFSFENFNEGVKVGVITNIRVTHKSIGMTNDSWEINRKQFVDTYSDVLPAKVQKTENDRLKILLSCLFFKNFTGSEVYVYELAKSLVKMGHDVTVMSEIGGPLTDMAKRANIKVISLKNPPGYKLGDGKWTVRTPDGNVIPSTPNSMYKLSEVYFDLIHTQHAPITEFVCNLYPNIEKIATIHSEVIELEKPIIHDSIKHYICIRPEIQEHITEVYDIDINKTSVVYNPVDDSRFISGKTDEKNAALFVGTIDYLRESSIRDMVEMTKDDGLEFWLVGENKSNYLDELLQFDHVKHFKSTWNTEKYIQQVKYTAGILLGRTTIESWMCGKPAWIYNVDSNGGILDKTLHEPPTNGEMDKFKLSNVSKLVHEKYLKVVNRK
jgi:hypothetical protein